MTADLLHKIQNILENSLSFHLYLHHIYLLTDVLISFIYLFLPNSTIVLLSAIEVSAFAYIKVTLIEKSICACDDGTIEMVQVLKITMVQKDVLEVPMS